MSATAARDILLKCPLCSEMSLNKQTLAAHAHKEHKQDNRTPKEIVNR